MTNQRQRDFCKYNQYIGCACVDPEEYCLWQTMNSVDNEIAHLNGALAHLRTQQGVNHRGPGQWRSLREAAERIVNFAATAEHEQPPFPTRRSD